MYIHVAYSASAVKFGIYSTLYEISIGAVPGFSRCGAVQGFSNSRLIHSTLLTNKWNMVKGFYDTHSHLDCKKLRKGLFVGGDNIV